MRRQPIEWKGMFTDYISGKGLVSGIYKKHLQLKGKRAHDPVLKWAKDLSDYFSKEDM